MLEAYMQNYCSYQQDDWSDLLPLTEYAYNSAISEATNISQNIFPLWSNALGPLLAEAQDVARPSLTSVEDSTAPVLSLNPVEDNTVPDLSLGSVEDMTVPALSPSVRRDLTELPTSSS
jgi:hypothetical protein